MDHVECVVAGAGVIGLAVARALAMAGRDVLILETGDRIGSETSSRNSEVIHAGIYYPADSAKAIHCVAGREQLYQFAQERGIPFRRCGKLIVATQPFQMENLQTILRGAERCGVDDLLLMDGQEATRIEPALNAKGALMSPSTGIIDSHAFMLTLQGEAEDHGARIAFRTRIVGGSLTRDDKVMLSTRSTNGDAYEFVTSLFVNCAGLGAQAVAASIEGFPAAHIPTLKLAKGNYFSVPGRCPFSRLIYPVPVTGGLGVHLTFDLAGQMRFGPDVEWVDAVDYRVDPIRCEAFYDEIRCYWPHLPDGGLEPAYSGIRPKLSGPNEPAADFAIEGPPSHGVPAIINLFGIESPGLTSSLSIAQTVLALAP